MKLPARMALTGSFLACNLALPCRRSRKSRGHLLSSDLHIAHPILFSAWPATYSCGRPPTVPFSAYPCVQHATRPLSKPSMTSAQSLLRVCRVPSRPTGETKPQDYKTRTTSGRFWFCVCVCVCVCVAAVCFGSKAGAVLCV